ncbi:YodL domain-containing protein [Guptibacillus spartinae]|uniref:YodL domain-containing protein n=1 Tax=Guptibacillus spartinae TaxID=3025679 RepID=UPI002361C0C5|nr:YodL domain-containing protein [Pseudalkalibacillus spartinae]
MRVEYKIHQVKRDLTRDFGFMGLQLLNSIGAEVSLANYNQVYEGGIELNSKSDTLEILEKLFAKFNVHHPKDYYGHSMSVSDIVEINNKYYYCDSFGWTQIEL